MSPRFKNYFLYALCFLSLAAFLQLCWHCRENSSFSKHLLSHYSYYGILILFCCFTYQLLCLFEDYKQILAGILRENLPGIIFCFVLCCFLFISCPPTLRVTGDENHLLDTAVAMTESKRVDYALTGEITDLNFKAIIRKAPIRSILFPFFTHLVQLAGGFRYWSSFAVNIFIYFIFLCLVFYLFKKFHDRFIAAAAVLVLCSNPVLIQTISSGAYDWLMLACILFYHFVLYLYLKNKNKSLIPLMFFTLMMIFNGRYEGPLIAFVAFAMAFPLIRKDLSLPEKSVYLCLGIWLVLPSVFRIFAFTQLPGTEYSKDPRTMFRAQNIWIGLQEFSRTCGPFKVGLPFSRVTSILGCLGLLLWIKNNLRSVRDFDKLSPGRKTFLLCAPVMLAQFYVNFAYLAGPFSHILSIRNSITYLVLLSLAVVYLGIQIIPKRKSIILVAAAMCLFLHYHPYAVEARSSNHYNMRREVYIVLDTVKDYSVGNILVLSNHAEEYTPHHLAAIYLAGLDTNGIATKFKHKVYAHIFVVQEIAFNNKKPIKKTEISDRFILKTVRESQNSSNHLIRVSEIVGVK